MDGASPDDRKNAAGDGSAAGGRECHFQMEMVMLTGKGCCCFDGFGDQKICGVVQGIVTVLELHTYEQIFTSNTTNGQLLINIFV